MMPFLLTGLLKYYLTFVAAQPCASTILFIYVSFAPYGARDLTRNFSTDVLRLWRIERSYLSFLISA